MGKKDCSSQRALILLLIVPEGYRVSVLTLGRPPHPLSIYENSALLLNAGHVNKCGLIRQSKTARISNVFPFC